MTTTMMMMTTIVTTMTTATKVEKRKTNILKRERERERWLLPLGDSALIHLIFRWILEGLEFDVDFFGVQFSIVRDIPNLFFTQMNGDR